jgi:hypothetical protein
LPEGQRLAHLFGIAQDLRACRDYIKLYVALTATKPSLLNHQMLDCVMTTIVIRYGRCFGQSARDVTQKELRAQLNAEDLETHNLIFALRDKHYAHSENYCELPEIHVCLTEGGPERKATNVSVGAHYINAGDPTILHNMRVLLSKLLTWTINEQKKESARLLPIVFQKYSLDELYALIGKYKRHQVTFGDLNKKRPKF